MTDISDLDKKGWERGMTRDLPSQSQCHTESDQSGNAAIYEKGENVGGRKGQVGCEGTNQFAKVTEGGQEEKKSDEHWQEVALWVHRFREPRAQGCA